MDGPADGGVFIDQEDLPAAEHVVLRGRPGFARRHLLPDHLDHLLDVPGVAEDPLEPLGRLGVVAGVVFQQAHRIVEDFVDREGHGAVDRLDAGGPALAFSADSSSSVFSAVATSARRSPKTPDRTRRTHWAADSRR